MKLFFAQFGSLSRAKSKGVEKNIIMKKYILLTFNFFLFFSFLSAQQLNYSDHVDPMIGTGGHGHTFPGATVPFGMVQLSPDTRVDGSWDGCSGYHYSDSIIYGFSHTHLSGTGIGDWCDISVLPLTDTSLIHQEKRGTKASYGFLFNPLLHKG